MTLTFLYLLLFVLLLFHFYSLHLTPLYIHNPPVPCLLRDYPYRGHTCFIFYSARKRNVTSLLILHVHKSHHISNTTVTDASVPLSAVHTSDIASILLSLPVNSSGLHLTERTGYFDFDPRYNSADLRMQYSQNSFILLIPYLRTLQYVRIPFYVTLSFTSVLF